MVHEQRSTRVFRLRSLVAAIAATLPIAAAAQDAAQDVREFDIDVAALHEIDDDRTDIRHEGFSIDEIEDMDVFRDGEVIGEVEAVLGDESGRIVALVVEYDDGFLGLGDDEVVVPIDQLEFDVSERRVTTTLTDEQLRAMPIWDD